MNRTDRLMAIVLELRGKGRVRAEDLAATFEVNKRTIYRDVQALCEAGVPVVAVPGQGYSLVEGYFLPPLAFSREEAIILLLGSEHIAENFDAQYRSAAQSATRKIEAVLSDALRAEVRELQRGIRFIAPSVLDAPGEAETLAKLRRAVIERKTVRFEYTSRPAGDGHAEPTKREADPYGLVHSGGIWFVTAWCHLRHAVRHFRLDRIGALDVTHATFERPDDFQLDRRPADDRHLVVRVRFDAASARWVQESRSFFVVAEEMEAGGLLLTLRVRREDDVFQWVLGWGAHAEVLEPESLRRRIAAEAAALQKLYERENTLLT